MFRNGYRLFLFMLVFAPLAFGSVEQWSLSVLEVLSPVALLLFVNDVRKEGGTALYEVPGLVPLLLLWTCFSLQVIPLPPGLVKVLSRAAYDLHAGAEGAGGPAGWIPLAVDRKAAILELLRFTASAAFYILTVQMLTGRERLKETVNVLIVLVSFLSFQGILQHILYNGRIFWFRELTLGGTPFGPFVNRNHYAGFMGMVFPVVLAVFLALKPRLGYSTFRERLSELFSRRETNSYILIGLAVVLAATSVFLSLSRSGIVSLGLSVIVLGAVLFRRNRRRGIIIMSVCLLIVLSVGWFGWEPVFRRFDRVTDVYGNIADLRPVIWRDSVSIIRDFAVTGSGFGSFFSVYPRYRTLAGEGIVDHAHNDYLELLAEGGLLSFVLAGWFVAAVLYVSYRRFLRRKESYSVYLFAGGLAGMAAILIHSVTDFNLHIGSNGLYFFFLAGLVVSAANTRFRDNHESTYLRPVKRPPLKLIRIFLALVILAGILLNAGMLLGDVSFSVVRGMSLGPGTEEKRLLAAKEIVGRALSFDPFEAEYLYAAGNIEISLSQPQKAIPYYKGAVRQAPLNGEYIQRLGLAYGAVKDKEKAERLLKRGVEVAPRSHARYRTYAAWLFAQDRVEEAKENIHTAIALSPERAGEYITFMVLRGLSDEEMLGVLPEKVFPYLAFGDYLNQTGRGSEAEKVYLKALGFIDGEKVVNPSFFYRVYGFYVKRGLFEEALKVMQKAITFLPGDAGIRLTAGRMYERLGMKNKAADEYRRVLVLNPGNIEAYGRLEAISNE